MLRCIVFNIGDIAILENNFLDANGVLVVIDSIHQQEYTFEYNYIVRRLSGDKFTLSSKTQDTIIVGEIDLVPL